MSNKQEAIRMLYNLQDMSGIDWQHVEEINNIIKFINKNL